MDPVIFDFKANWLKKLIDILVKTKAAREEEISRIADVFGDPYQLAEFYIEPNCQQLNPADDDEDEERYMVRQPIFERIRYFFGGKKLTSGHQLFVLADSGMGKSSILMMLKLANLKRFWPVPYRCELLKLGENTVPEIERIEKKNKTVLLLDALDEDPLAWGRIEPRIRELLQTSRPFWRVIITCRTQFFHGGDDPFNRRGHVEVAGTYCPVIFLSLFSDEQILDYLKKRFGKDKEKVPKALSVINQMKSLRFRPMLLAHIEDLLESENDDWNEYTIYLALVTAWLDRECTKSLNRRKMPRREDLLAACTEMAVKLYENGARELNDEEIGALVGKQYQNLNKLDIGGRSLLNKNSRGSFRFSHYSIQEFLVARDLIRGRARNRQEKLRVTDQLLSFLMAWFKSETIEKRSRLPLGSLGMKGICFSGTDLCGANFSACNIREIKFTDSQLDFINLESASLKYCDFKGATFSYGVLNNAKFYDCSLKDVNFSNASAEGVEFLSSDLEGSRFESQTLLSAEFVKSNLSGTVFENITFDSVNFVKTRFNGVTVFSGGTMKDVNFEADGSISGQFLNIEFKNVLFGEGEFSNVAFIDVRSRNLIFDNSKLEDSRFESSNIGNSKFRRANLRKAKFVDVRCGNASFLGADLFQAEFNDCSLKGALFSGASCEYLVFQRCDLSNAGLSRLDLRNTSFSSKCQFVGANLSHSLLGSCSFSECDFTSANLLDANLQSCKLAGSVFAGANLRSSVLRDAFANGIDLRGAVLDGANLSGCDLADAIYDSKTVFPRGFDPRIAGLVFRE